MDLSVHWLHPNAHCALPSDARERDSGANLTNPYITTDAWCGNWQLATGFANNVGRHKNGSFIVSKNTPNATAVKSDLNIFQISEWFNHQPMVRNGLFSLFDIIRSLIMCPGIRSWVRRASCVRVKLTAILFIANSWNKLSSQWKVNGLRKLQCSMFTVHSTKEWRTEHGTHQQPLGIFKLLQFFRKLVI